MSPGHGDAKNDREERYIILLTEFLILLVYICRNLKTNEKTLCRFIPDDNILFLLKG